MGDPMRPCLVLVAGGAGVGKTEVSKALVRRVTNAILLDKDRLLGAWVDRVLRASGEAVDRDGRAVGHPGDGGRRTTRGGERERQEKSESEVLHDKMDNARRFAWQQI